ncbi:integrase/recombinase xerD homolog [Amphiura filiformis]|uniref:integrase/recombinase xerD homolog n=1 Tax=Amphiura filiformis TaxID=82378 RepID=UPI003B22813A
MGEHFAIGAHGLTDLESQKFQRIPIIVKNAAEGLKRKLASPTVKKEPITAEILVKVYDYYCADLSIKNLLTIRTVTMCLIAYAGFLRFDELSEIKREHVTFELSHMSILIPSSKTDIYRQGKSVIIARLTSRVCPVRMLQKYLELAQVQDSCSFIFRSLSATKMGCKLRKDNRLMSDTRVREVILDALKPIVGDTSKFGVHSLRSGGATEAANAGVPERLFKRHSRWRSDSAKDGYVKESLSKLLSVSQSLGL